MLAVHYDYLVIEVFSIVGVWCSIECQDYGDLTFEANCSLLLGFTTHLTQNRSFLPSLSWLSTETSTTKTYIHNEGAHRYVGK